MKNVKGQQYINFDIPAETFGIDYIEEVPVYDSPKPEKVNQFLEEKMSRGTVLNLKSIQMFQFPGGVKEFVIYDDTDYFRRDGVYKSKRGRVGKSASDVSKRDRGIAIARAKKTLRRISLANQMCRLLTLTTRENITDFEVMDKHFNDFIYQLRQVYPDLKYIAVRERQGRGSVHYHVLINRFVDHKKALPIWNAIAGEGSVNLVKREGLRAVAYLSKYLGKSMDEGNFITKKGHNAKSYLSSHDLPKDYKSYRKTFRFYMDLEIEQGRYNEWVAELNQLLGSSEVVFDKVFCFEQSGDTKICRSILLQTG